MPTAEETIDLKEALTAEDLPIEKILELRRSIHCSIERRSEAEKILDNFSEVAKKLSSENKAETRRAALLWILGRVEEAIPLFEKARVSKEKSYLLGASYLDVGRARDAMAQLKDAYDADSSDPNIASDYAEAMVRSGEYEDADKLLERLAKKHPENADVCYVRGLWNDLQGYRDRALESYERAMELEPGHAKSLFRTAYIYDLIGEDARAMELYGQLRKMRPLHVNTMVNLGVLYEDRDEFEKAAECFRAVLDYFPNHTRARLYLSDAQASLGMFYDEEAARREQKLAQVMGQPLAEITFSQRVRNGLAGLGISTIGELVQKTEEELLDVPNFGKTSLREVKEFLSSKGLSMASGSREGAAEAPAVAPGTPPPPEVESKALADFEWSGRIRGVFEKLNLKTIGDLLGKTETELMEHRNLGITSIKEIRRKLGSLGVAMRTE